MYVMLGEEGGWLTVPCFQGIAGVCEPLLLHPPPEFPPFEVCPTQPAMASMLTTTVPNTLARRGVRRRLDTSVVIFSSPPLFQAVTGRSESVRTEGGTHRAEGSVGGLEDSVDIGIGMRGRQEPV